MRSQAGANLVSLIELRRRRAAPRVFVEAQPGLQRRVSRALSALGDLPDGFDPPGLDALSEALIDLADELDAEIEDLEDDEMGDDEALPLFEWSARRL